ncbi:MAG: rod-binding protein [Spirochaetaceae bacterium]
MSINNIDPNLSTATNRAKALQDSVNRDDTDKKLLETCKEFESMFVKQMLDSMKKTVNKSGFIKENMGEQIFDDMLNDEYSKKIADTSGFGIAEMMYKQLAGKKYQ